MAQDEGGPSAAEKGKAKATDIKGEKEKGKSNPEKEGKPTANSKMAGDLPEGDYNHQRSRLIGAVRS
jgi:hypothetical protein